MRSALLLVVAIAAVGCDSDIRASKIEALTSHQAVTETVTYITLKRPEELVKHFPEEPDPAEDADDPVSCENAGGDWDDFYALGVLAVREPEEGAEWVGKMCWSRRRPEKLADAGKVCSGQADCIGNCMAEQQNDGKWSGPKCQAYAAESVCGPIYEGGQYHWIICPIP